MEKPKKSGLLVFSAVVFSFLMAACIPLNSAYATNGYFSHGFGTRYKAMAGAGVAVPMSAMAAAVNPALMAHVGNRADIGAALFNPNRQYSVSGNPSGFPGTFGLMPLKVSSRRLLFVVPSAGANLSLPGGHNIGLTIYGNGGMNTDYDAPVFGMQPTGVDLTQLFVAGTYARKVGRRHTLGISGIFAYQRFKAEGLQAFSNFSSDPSHLTNNDYAASTGFGARIGYYGEIFPLLAVGVSYQTRIRMSPFDEYAGLFAEEGGFDIPATWTAGFALKATPLLTFAFDLQQIRYSEVKSIANPLLPNLMKAQLGDDNGAGFGWEDILIYKLGFQWIALPGLTLRAGYSRGDQPIPGSQVLFNILAPAVIQQHFSLGFSKTILPTIQLHFALTRAFSNSISGPNPLEAPDRQKIELKMDQWDGGVGLSFSL